VGELLSPIGALHPAQQFRGYYGDAAASEHKVLRDAFRRGDSYFRTGDLLRRDGRGCYHFEDRVGDTFRWKGQNVSTEQVSVVLNAFPGLLASNVYGILVDGCEGRACMAALVVDGDMFDWDSFGEFVTDQLEPYAVPLFVRTVDELATTATFKNLKIQLQAEGADVGACDQRVWRYDARRRRYLPLSDQKEEMPQSRL
jgi:fatty-acyl-CoA synthase